jgi:uncharacterized protein
MHEIAFVDSDFLVPAAVYIGNKLRHPLRLYADPSGKICCLVCETSIELGGVRSVLDTVVKWTVANNFREVILLGGISSDYSNSNIIGSKRQPIVLPSDGKVEDSSYIEYINKSEGLSSYAVIGGPLGGLVTTCLSKGMPCKVILIRTLKDIADAEGVSILIEWLNKNLESLFKVSVAPLKEKAKDLNDQVEKIIKSVENPPADGAEKDRMYG